MISKCNCELCRIRSGDNRKCWDMQPLEGTIPFLERIFNMVDKEMQVTFPDTEYYRSLYYQYKAQGYNVKIKTDEVIL